MSTTGIGRVVPIVILLALGMTSQLHARSELPPALRDLQINPQLNGQVPLDLTFRNERGESVRLGDYFDGERPVILVLAYYKCPMLCTLVLNGLTDGMRNLAEQRGFRVGEQFNVVVVSFDPRETPDLAAAKKASYLQQYGDTHAKGWHFLTGEEPAIKQLTQAVGFKYRFDTATGQFNHDSAIIMLTPKGKIARYFYGIEYATMDLYYGLVEASQHRIGKPIQDRVALLFCYGYDPATGKYKLTIMNLVRIASAVTVLGLAAMLFLLWRRDGRKSAEAGGS